MWPYGLARGSLSTGILLGNETLSTGYSGSVSVKLLRAGSHECLIKPPDIHSTSPSADIPPKRGRPAKLTASEDVKLADYGYTKDHKCLQIRSLDDNSRINMPNEEAVPNL